MHARAHTHIHTYMQKCTPTHTHFSVNCCRILSFFLHSSINLSTSFSFSWHWPLSSSICDKSPKWWAQDLVARSTCVWGMYVYVWGMYVYEVCMCMRYVCVTTREILLALWQWHNASYNYIKGTHAHCLPLSANKWRTLVWYMRISCVGSYWCEFQPTSPREEWVTDHWTPLTVKTVESFRESTLIS